MPSPGELHFLEQQDLARVHAANREAEALQARRVVQAQAVVHATARSSTAARTMGTGMAYSETHHQLGSVVVDPQPGGVAASFVVIPGQFGSALSVVMTMSVGTWRRDPEDGTHLWVWPVTTLDGDNWIVLDSGGQSAERIFWPGRPAAHWRINGPFASRLGLQLAVKNSNQYNDNKFMPGQFSDVSLAIGVQQI